MTEQEVWSVIDANPSLTHTELAKLLTAKGFPINRKAVYNRRKRKEMRRVLSSTAKTKTPEERLSAEKERLLRIQCQRAERATLKDQALHDLLMDTLREAISPLQFQMPEVVIPQGGDSREEIAVLLLSDIHFGKITPYYNLELAVTRLHRVVEGFISIVQLHRHAYPIRHLHIFWNGDIVDGSSIYPTQTHHADANMVNQIFGAMPAVVGELALLATVFETVTCHCQ